MYYSTVLLLTQLSMCLFLRLTFAKNSNESIDVTTHPNWHLVSSDNCGSSLADRIVGGRDANLGQYPWIAMIGYITHSNPKAPVAFLCGGSLINQKYVVTAAHCIINIPYGFEIGFVRLGEHNVDTNPDCSYDNVCAEPVQDIKPAQVFVHKDYNTRLFKNDIAMIRLEHDAVLNGWVVPICLPYSTLLTKDYVGENAEVAGWGVFDLEYPMNSIILQTVTLPVVDVSRCTAAFEKFTRVGETQICAGGKIGQDSCGGDSGGPLMKADVLDGPPKYFLLGLVSFGPKTCGETTNPAVYTRVASYMQWILDILAL